MIPIPKTVTPEEFRRFGPILPKTFTGDPQAALSKIGPQLHQLLLLNGKSGDLLRVLWKRYLADCRRHGVKPAGAHEPKCECVTCYHHGPQEGR